MSFFWIYRQCMPNLSKLRFITSCAVINILLNLFIMYRTRGIEGSVLGIWGSGGGGRSADWPTPACLKQTPVSSFCSRNWWNNRKKLSEKKALRILYGGILGRILFSAKKITPFLRSPEHSRIDLPFRPRGVYESSGTCVDWCFTNTLYTLIASLYLMDELK